MNPRVLLVTGSSRGIGAATARLAAERGYAVAINYRQNERLAEVLAEELGRGGARTFAVGADVSREDEVVRMFEAVDRELGPVTALVNNAGIVDRQCRVQDMTPERIDRIFATNIKGAFLCAREAIRRMSPSCGGQGGAIVNVSSAASRLGAPGEYVDYAASKGAMDSMTLGLAREVAGEKIRVNAVRPAFVYTDIHASGGEPDRVDRIKGDLPMKRGAQPHEVAAAILWLLSDEASYVTGTFIDMAGGR